MAISINLESMKLVREVLEKKELLGIEVSQMKCKAHVIDMGVNAFGSYEAGIYYNRIMMGGLGIVNLASWKLDEEYSFSAVEVFVTDTHHGVLVSQLAGWPLEKGPFAAIGSGPARALAQLPTDPYMKLTDYVDNHHEAVLCIQTIKFPSEEMALEIASKAGVDPENLYLLISSNASLVGSMQIAGRSVEQIYHKMVLGGIPHSDIKNARGIAPIAPVFEDQVKAMGRINDAITYGAHSEFWVTCSDELIEKVLPSLTAKTSSPYYPEPFEETYRRASMDFFNMDPDGDSGARVQIHNMRTGKTHLSGEINYEIIKKSFLE